MHPDIRKEIDLERDLESVLTPFFAVQRPQRFLDKLLMINMRVCQLLRYDTDEVASRFGIRLWMLSTIEVWRRLVVEGESVDEF